MSVVKLVEIIEHYPKREEYFTDGEFAMACERFFKYKLKPKFDAFKKQLEELAHENLIDGTMDGIAISRFINEVLLGDSKKKE